MIKKVTIKNFKAIKNAALKLTDLTVLVGNNGSGKSSVIEALQTLQRVLVTGLSTGFNERWFGLDHVRYQNHTNPAERAIELNIRGKLDRDGFEYGIAFNTSADGELYLVTREFLKRNGRHVFQAKVLDGNGQAELIFTDNSQPVTYRANQQVLAEKELHNNHEFVLKFANYIKSWQFLTLEPERMYYPARRDYGQTTVRLKSSGENLADYFSRFQDNADQSNLILDKMKYVLPDLDLLGREEIAIQKQIYLYLQSLDQDKRLPSWLFSSGTLRILAMLTLLNSSHVPPVVFIEEIENGLDPRTLNLLVEEMRGLLPDHQFITTSHSPYFLDLVDLRHVVVAERNQGQTTFYRPDDDARLDAWKQKFSAGSLYTMNKLERA